MYTPQRVIVLEEEWLHPPLIRIRNPRSKIRGTQMRSRFRCAWLLTLLLLPGWSRPGGITAQVAHQHHPESIPEYIRALEDPERDAWQKPAQVIANLALKPGESVADLGAGSGYF